MGDGDISINNINPKTNGNLYVDNANDRFNTEMDGFTITLKLKGPVIPGQVYTIKIRIADGGKQFTTAISLSLATPSNQRLLP